jgi:diamine N-acetyltransferase
METKTELYLKPIDRENWRAVCKLKLAAEQENYVAPNWYSIIEALLDYTGVPTVRSVAIMAGDTVIGYALYGYFPEDPTGECWVGRLMIGLDHQRKGYGRIALRQIVADLQTMADCSAILLSINPENAGARALYESEGFVHEGRIEDDELVFVYRGRLD